MKSAVLKQITHFSQFGCFLMGFLRVIKGSFKGLEHFTSGTCGDNAFPLQQEFQFWWSLEHQSDPGRQRAIKQSMLISLRTSGGLLHSCCCVLADVLLIGCFIGLKVTVTLWPIRQRPPTPRLRLSGDRRARRCAYVGRKKNEAPRRDEACHTCEMENLHMQVCSIWKCTKGLVLVPRLLQCVGLRPGEVVTVNIARGLFTTPLAAQTLTHWCRATTWIRFRCWILEFNVDT